MNTGIEFAEKLSKAYSETCKPLCHELNIPQTAFDILLFLANNPEYKTARDIVEIRKIKANLVSVNVDKLVNEGYLERKSVEGDRRKVNLSLQDTSGSCDLKRKRSDRRGIWDIGKRSNEYLQPLSGVLYSS